MKRKNKEIFFAKRIFCKKAATPSQILIDFWAALIIVLILATFFFILYVSQGNMGVVIKAQAAEFETNDELLYLLQSPVVIGNKSMSFSEAIAVSVHKDDFVELEKAFDQIGVSIRFNNCIDITLEYSGKKKSIPAVNNCERYAEYEHNTEKIYISKAELPSLDGAIISVAYSISKIIPEYRYGNE
ncbi:hypothetical protein HZA96_03985 [Candidatus Woesearchaeota archaeon]|nr:hypothetical protein [Candidatus Woesearchaeota archaeon]